MKVTVTILFFLIATGNHAQSKQDTEQWILKILNNNWVNNYNASFEGPDGYFLGSQYVPANKHISSSRNADNYSFAIVGECLIINYKEKSYSYDYYGISTIGSSSRNKCSKITIKNITNIVFGDSVTATRGNELGTYYSGRNVKIYTKQKGVEYSSSNGFSGKTDNFFELTLSIETEDNLARRLMKAIKHLQTFYPNSNIQKQPDIF